MAIQHCNDMTAVAQPTRSSHKRNFEKIDGLTTPDSIAIVLKWCAGVVDQRDRFFHIARCSTSELQIYGPHLRLLLYQPNLSLDAKGGLHPMLSSLAGPIPTMPNDVPQQSVLGPGRVSSRKRLELLLWSLHCLRQHLRSLGFLPVPRVLTDKVAVRPQQDAGRDTESRASYR